MQIFTEVPYGGLILAVTSIWAVTTLCWLVLQLARLRMPAPMYWLFPCALLTTGVLTTGLHVMNGAEGSVAIAEATEPLWLSLMLTAGGLTLGAMLIGLANITRGGPRASWSLGHALGAIPAAIGALIGVLSGPLAFAAGAIGTFAIGISAIRIGRTQRDRGRMASGRVLVASLAAMGPLFLALAHGLKTRMDWALIAGTAEFATREAELEAVLDPAIRVLIGDIGVTVGLIVAGALVSAPVSRFLVDGRSSAGAVLTGFLIATVGMLAVPATLPLLQLELADEETQRRNALLADGIELSEAESGEPWSPGQNVTIGVYWISVDGERATPVRGGIIAASDLEEGAATGVLDAVTFEDGPITLELDRRATVLAFQPVIKALQRADRRNLCVVTRSTTGALSCLPASLHKSDVALSHVLLEQDTVLIVGDEGAKEVPFQELAWRLSKAPMPVALHANWAIHGQRLVDGLFELRKVTDEPVVLVVD